MEILALLLLGLIAMLAIVPPIIRGKLEESPLASTQSFQRSMQEMANSIESGAGDGRAGYGGKRPGLYAAPLRSAREVRLPPPHTRNYRKKNAAVRRSRIIAALTIVACIWGVAALLSGKAWCLVVFAIACILLLAFWAMTLIVPSLYTRQRPERRLEEPSRSPGSQAL